MATAYVTSTDTALQSDALLALAIMNRREDLVLKRIFFEQEHGGMSAHWAAAENLGLETYAIARRCGWKRADGKPDTMRARDAMEYLRSQGAVITVMRIAYPVRSYFATVEMMQALERHRM